LEVHVPARLSQYMPQQGPTLRGDAGSSAARLAWDGGSPDRLESVVAPDLLKHLAPALRLELSNSSTPMPSAETILEAMRRLNEAVLLEESRFLTQVGARLRGGRVAFLNAAHLSLRLSVHRGLVSAEEQRTEHQWDQLQVHRQSTEREFMAMVQRRMSDTGGAKMLAENFFDVLAREWLDETLVAVAADIRAQCLADMPDAGGAAERAYQQAFVERNWEDVIEYVLDVNAYLRKIFGSLFEERKVSVTRAQRPRLAAQLGGFFDALSAAANRWGHRKAGKAAKLSDFQEILRGLAVEARSGPSSAGRGGSTCEVAGHQDAWPLLSERFPVVADFNVDDPARFAHEFCLQLSELLAKTAIDGLVAERLENALQKQEAQVWALIRGCTCTCPCCGSKCHRVDNHTLHHCGHHLLPAFNGWRVAGSCEAALDSCTSSKNHEAPKRSDFSDHLFPNLQEYLEAEHSEWMPFPREDRDLLADSVLKAAWVNCRVPLLFRYDMVDNTPAEWIAAYEEPHRKLVVDAVDRAEERLMNYGYCPDVSLEGGGES